MDDIIVTRHMIGLTAMQVCAIKGLCDKTILDAANRLNELCGG
jgi:hypothetical protein